MVQFNFRVLGQQAACSARICASVIAAGSVRNCNILQHFTRAAEVGQE